MNAKTIIITGGTSGIGQALASEFLTRGYSVGITGRDAKKLKKSEQLIRKSHPNGVLKTLLLDVTKYKQTIKAIPQLTKLLGGQLDILVANAGVGAGGGVSSKELVGNLNCFDTNINAAVATLSAGVDVMKKQKSGQLVGISSVAGFRGIPAEPAYSASKSALTSYLEALRGAMHPFGIKVTTILPGYIDTPINQAMESRPFVIPVEKGAKIIADRIEAKRNIAIVPWFPWAFMGCVMRNIPDFIWKRLAPRQTSKA